MPSLKCTPVNLSRFYGTVFAIFVLSKVGRSLKFNLSKLNASIKAQPTKLGFLRINPFKNSQKFTFGLNLLLASYYGRDFNIKKFLLAINI